MRRDLHLRTAGLFKARPAPPYLFTIAGSSMLKCKSRCGLKTKSVMKRIRCRSQLLHRIKYEEDQNFPRVGGRSQYIPLFKELTVHQEVATGHQWPQRVSF